MRGRPSCVATIVTTVLLCAGPAMALETKPTAPPTPVAVSPQAPYIESVRYAGGNGDFIPDPGERLQVFFSLRNTTDKALSSVTGTLAIKDPNVTVVDGTASWPDIAPGALKESTTPFVIQIADEAKRSTPCSGGPIALPAPGSAVPVASDSGKDSSEGTISSDGNTGSGGTGSAGAPTSVPGSEPGSTGTVKPDATVGPEPSLVEPAPDGSSAPAPGGSIEPTPPGTIEPAPGGSVEPAPAPDTNAPVPFAAAVIVHTSAGSFDTSYVSGLACPLALGAPGTAGGAAEVAPVADLAASAKSASSSSSAPFVIAVLLVAAGSLVARYRFTL
jgi:hypothetical protein